MMTDSHKNLRHGVCGEPRHAIVYVEDNPSNVAFMEDLLGDLDGVKLLTAPSAELGIELVRAHRPDIVVMDINLPGMSGVEATRALASWPETRDIPVIGLSATTGVRGAKPRGNDGFYRYLTKPVNVGELLAVFDELLARARLASTRERPTTRAVAPDEDLARALEPPSPQKM